MKTSLVFRKKGTTDWFTWEQAHVVWLLQQLNVANEDGGLGPDPEEPEHFHLYPHAPGSMMTPWTMRTIEQWRGAAAQNIGGGYDTGMYEVGGVMLERNPSEGAFNNYITAVKDSVRNPLAVSRKESPRGNLLIFDEDADRSEKMIYEIKCERLNAEGRDQEVAALARSLMKREVRDVPRRLLELPNTLGAMFISEVARLPLMLPLGIMMLDLMEADVVYGRTTPKHYTWKKLMSYTGPEVGQGRLQAAQLYGGKHPMMHENTIKQAKVFAESYNMVTLRSISVVVAWLHVYLKSNACAWETLVEREDRASFDLVNPRAITRTQLKQFGQRLGGGSPHAEFYTSAVKPALLRRSGTLDRLF